MSSVIGVVAGCGGQNFENENDRLRQQNLALSEELAERDRQIERLNRLVASLRQADDVQAKASELVQLQCSSIEIGRYSTCTDSDRDGKDDTIRVYLETYDARGRFVQVVGQSQLHVVAIDNESTRSIAKCSFDPNALAKQYRSGLAGTHYTLSCPLDTDAIGNVDELTVYVTLNDHVTGLSYKKQGTIAWRH